MKKLILIAAVFLSVNAMAQKKDKGYGFIGAGVHFFNQAQKQSNFGGRINLGVMPVPTFGIGADIQFIQNYGTPVMGDFRYIGKNEHGSRPTFAIKVGQNFYNKLHLKGSLVYGAEAGVIFGKMSSGFYVTAQYLSLKYIDTEGSYKVNDFGINVGVKF